MIVMKFGGTSVGSAVRIHDVARIVADVRARHEVVVVTSAMSKVTDLLVSASMNASRQQAAQLDRDLEQLRDIHTRAVRELQLPSGTAAALTATIDERFATLESILRSVTALGELSPRALDLIISYGERLSIHLLAAAITQAGHTATPVEATRLIVTTDHFGDARPLLPQSRKLARPVLSRLLKAGQIPVVTGFVGATAAGITSTLGRGGSDYTATILGHCLDADEVWIWTDVDGVMTADPRIVPEARTIDALSYNEAAELSYFGAKVLHPLTIVPAALKDIPVLIKNTFNPAAPGTRISAAGSDTEGTTISSMKGLSLITVQGRGMIGVPGVAAKVFGAIAARSINVLFISQASSEYNISLVVHHGDGRLVTRILRDAFAPEITAKDVETVRLEEQLAIIAVVGEGMKGRPGVAGQTFSALGDAGVNIVAIAQGSSERNISLVVAESDIPTAVRSIHSAFHHQVTT